MKQPRWKVLLAHTAEEVVKLRGSVHIEHSLARKGAERFWDQLHGGSKKGYVNALGALTVGKRYNKRKPVLKLFIYQVGR